MVEAHEGSRSPMRWYDSYLVETGAWICLLATIANLLCVWDFSPIGFRSMAERILLAFWEGGYSVALAFGAWNLGRRKLKWRFTLSLAAMVVADFFIWGTLRERAGFEDLTLVLFIPVKFVFVLFLLLLAQRESALRGK